MKERYECDQCGACCRKLIIEIDELDIIREPKLATVAKPFKIPAGMSLIDEDGEPREEVVPGFGNGAMLAAGIKGCECPLIGEDNRCMIYPTRPNVCVAMQAGSEQCQECRERSGLTPLLPIVQAVEASAS